MSLIPTFIVIPVQCGTSDTLTKEQIEKRINLGEKLEDIEAEQEASYEYKESDINVETIIGCYTNSDNRTIIELYSHNITTSYSRDQVNQLMEKAGCKIIKL
jgi:hypothetical protein